MAKDATVFYCSPKSLKKPKLPMPERKLSALHQPNIRLTTFWSAAACRRFAM
jgi:hypothetical protein